MDIPSPSDGGPRGRGRHWPLRLVGVFLLLAVLYRTDGWAMWKSSWGSLDAAWLALATGLNIANLAPKMLRWRGMIAAVHGRAYPVGRAIRATVISIALGIFTPGRTGDLLRVGYARRDLGLSYPAAFGALVVDRACDLAVLAAVSGVAALSVFGTRSGLGVALSGLAIFLVLVAVGAVISRWGPTWMARHPRWGESASAFRAAASWRPVTGGLVAAGIAFGVFFAQGWCVSQALGLTLTYSDSASLLSVAAFLSLIPVTIAGLGVRETFLAAAFPIVGASAGDGVVFGLTLSLVVYAAIGIAGALFALLDPFRPGESVQGVSSKQ